MLRQFITTIRVDLENSCNCSSVTEGELSGARLPTVSFLFEKGQSYIEIINSSYFSLTCKLHGSHCT